MKRRKRTSSAKSGVIDKINARRTRRLQRADEERIDDMLKICLQKVCQLQNELERTQNLDDPEAEGYAACVMETLRFLSAQGLPPNHPIVKALTDRFLKKRDEENPE